MNPYAPSVAARRALELACAKLGENAALIEAGHVQQSRAGYHALCALEISVTGKRGISKKQHAALCAIAAAWGLSEHAFGAPILAYFAGYPVDDVLIFKIARALGARA